MTWSARTRRRGMDLVQATRPDWRCWAWQLSCCCSAGATAAMMTAARQRRAYKSIIEPSGWAQVRLQRCRLAVESQNGSAWVWTTTFAVPHCSHAGSSAWFRKVQSVHAQLCMLLLLLLLDPNIGTTFSASHEEQNQHHTRTVEPGARRGSSSGSRLCGWIERVCGVSGAAARQSANRNPPAARMLARSSSRRAAVATRCPSSRLCCVRENGCSVLHCLACSSW